MTVNANSRIMGTYTLIYNTYYHRESAASQINIYIPTHMYVGRGLLVSFHSAVDFYRLDCTFHISILPARRAHSINNIRANGTKKHDVSVANLTSNQAQALIDHHSRNIYPLKHSLCESKKNLSFPFQTINTLLIFFSFVHVSLSLKIICK